MFISFSSCRLLNPFQTHLNDATLGPECIFATSKRRKSWVFKLSVQTTNILNIFYKGQAIRDARRNFCKNRGQSLAPPTVQGTAESARGK